MHFIYFFNVGLDEAFKALNRDGTFLFWTFLVCPREPVTEMDLERNAVREAELRRKQEVRKEALTAHDKEIWNREMQVSFILLKPVLWIWIK